MNSGLHPSYRRRLRKARTNVPQFAFSNALHFDGVNDHAIVNVGVSAGQMPAVTRNGTISFWMRWTTTGFVGMFSWGASGNSLRAETNPSGTTLTIGGAFLLDPRAIATLSWNHFLLTWQDEGASVRMKLYVNGILVSNTTVTSWPTGATEFRVGGITGSPARYSGRYDEWLVYDRPLDSAEILALWGAGYGTRYVPQSGLLARWAFDESSGTTAFDSSGNGRHLTLFNGPVFLDHYAA